MTHVEEAVGEARGLARARRDRVVEERERLVRLVGDGRDADAGDPRAGREARLERCEPLLARDRAVEELRVAADELLAALLLHGAFHLGDERGRDHAQRNAQRRRVDLLAREKDVDRLLQVEDGLRALLGGNLHVSDRRCAERELLERRRPERRAREHLREPRLHLHLRNVVHLRDRELERLAPPLGRLLG